MGTHGECLIPTKNTLPPKSQTTTTTKCFPSRLKVRHHPFQGLWCGRRRTERCGTFPVVNRILYRETEKGFHVYTNRRHTRHVGMVDGGWCCPSDSVDGHTLVSIFTHSRVAASYDHRRVILGGCRSAGASRRIRRRKHGRPRRTSRARVSHLPCP